MAKTPSRQELDLLSPIAWVKEEMERQMHKWGEQNHNPLRYYCTLAEEYGEVGKAINDILEGSVDPIAGLDNVEYELIQTAAVSVAMVHAIRRAKGTHSLLTPVTIDAKREKANV